MVHLYLLDQELISHLYSSCFCSCWGNLLKKPKALSFQIVLGENLAGLYLKKCASIHGVRFLMSSCFYDGSHFILSRNLRLCHFKSDRDEIWQECPSYRYALIGVLRFSI